MLKINSYEAKTLEEAKNKAITDLNVTEKDLYIIDSIIESGKLFKSTKHLVNVITKSDVKKYIKEIINNISELMEIDLQSEIREEDGVYNVILVSSNNAILIGKEGKTLISLQVIIRQIVKNQTNLNLKINLDIANYKANKIKNLEYEIKKIAKEVQNSKIDVSLDPMNSFERRAIHNLINNMNNLKTESIGEGKDRHIVIKYVENK